MLWPARRHLECGHHDVPAPDRQGLVGRVLFLYASLCAYKRYRDQGVDDPPPVQPPLPLPAPFTQASFRSGTRSRTARCRTCGRPSCRSRSTSPGQSCSRWGGVLCVPCPLKRTAACQLAHTRGPPACHHPQNHTVFPHSTQVSTSARGLLMAMLERDPRKRITAAKALEHPWLKVCVVRLAAR